MQDKGYKTSFLEDSENKLSSEMGGGEIMTKYRNHTKYRGNGEEMGRS